MALNAYDIGVTVAKVFNRVGVNIKLCHLWVSTVAVIGGGF